MACDERRYTLEEAQRELNIRDCQQFGHRFEHVVHVGEPISLFCSRCGRSWAITPAEGQQQ